MLRYIVDLLYQYFFPFLFVYSTIIPFNKYSISAPTVIFTTKMLTKLKAKVSVEILRPEQDSEVKAVDDNIWTKR